MIELMRDGTQMTQMVMIKNDFSSSLRSTKQLQV